MSVRRYDPELAPLIPALPAAMDWSDLPGARRQLLDLVRGLAGGAPHPEGLRVEDRHVPGRSGDPEVRVRVYRPQAAGPQPAVLYLHGGGFCLGSIETEDAGAASLAGELPALVVSVDYRLAPEDPFPAAIEDCYAALSWMAASAGELGLDPSRIAVVGGSAGGGLAAGVALMARDRGGPALCFQVLNIPELDDRLDTPSMRSFTDTPLWSRPNAIVSWRNYLGPMLGGDVSPYAAPARAEDLAGLPPAYVSTMEYDPLRDEGILYALRMLQQGVNVELHQFPGTFHGSALLTHAEVSRRASREMLDALRRGLAAKD